MAPHTPHGRLHAPAREGRAGRGRGRRPPRGRPPSRAAPGGGREARVVYGLFMCAPAAPGWPKPCASADILGPARSRSRRVRAGVRVTAGRVGGGPVRRAARVATGPAAGPGCPLAESSPLIRGSPASGPHRGAAHRPACGRGADDCRPGIADRLSPRARFAARMPGHTRGRRSGRGSRARAGPEIGRTVTQKHRQSTLRSTSGGCLCVTRREDCGRVPSKQRCLGVRIMPIVGRHALRLRILTPHEPGGSCVSRARELSPRGMGYVGSARRTTGVATGAVAGRAAATAFIAWAESRHVHRRG